MSGKNKLVGDSYKVVKHVSTTKSSGATPSTSRTSSTSHSPSTSSDCVTSVLTDDIEILKQFDLTLEYGPCIGITRLERWERAKQHDMKPPENVRNILLQHKNDPEYTESLWKDYQL